ncbi:MAG TPA: hypothetical protein VEA18_02875, partial [Candidatus Kapabacteria bacterium]|nr:hypothetical protein [Candidatus Kapabacteria bacterium]
MQILRGRSREILWMLVATALFVTVAYFTFGFKFLSSPTVAAETNTWIGGATGVWETAGNWSLGVVPTSTTIVVISSSTVTLSSGQTADFGTLQIGDGTNTSTLILVGNIGTGGSITIKNKGYLEQKNTTTQTITGTMTIENGGTLTHTANDTSQSYELDFAIGTLDVQSGGSINVDGKGYTGGLGVNPGNGPGAGKTRVGGSGSSDGSGAGHGGDGGITDEGHVGGVAYCDITNPATIGSGGGGVGSGSSVQGGSGGGLIILNVTGTSTINGTISAKGSMGANNGAGNGAGGGAGGGVKITAGTIAGTPTSFSVVGGDGHNTGTGSGAGGGGCVLLTYTTSTSITGTSITMR